MILTLLHERENPKEIFKHCKELGIKAFHIELNGAN
jgi:hypothetical protein